MKYFAKNIIIHVAERMSFKLNSYNIIAFLSIFCSYLFYTSYVFYSDIANNLLTQANIFRQNFEQKLIKYSNILDVVSVNMEHISATNIPDIIKTLKLTHDITFADEDFQNSTINWLTNDQKPLLITSKGVLKDNYFQQVGCLPNAGKSIVIINRDFGNDLWINSAMLCKPIFNKEKQYIGMPSIQFSLDALYQGLTKELNTNYYNFVITDKDQNPLLYDHFTVYTKAAEAVNHDLRKNMKFFFLGFIKTNYITLPTNVINDENYNILAKINYEYLYRQLVKMLFTKSLIFLLIVTISLFFLYNIKSLYDTIKFYTDKKKLLEQEKQNLTLLNDIKGLQNKLSVCQARLVATETAAHELDLFTGEFISFCTNTLAVKTVGYDVNIIPFAKLKTISLVEIVSVAEIFNALMNFYEKALLEKEIVLTIDNQVKYEAPLQVLFNLKYFMVLALNNILDFAAEQSKMLIKIYPIIENSDTVLINIDIIDFCAFTRLVEEPPLRKNSVSTKFSSLISANWETIEHVAITLNIKLTKTFSKKNKTVSIGFQIVKNVVNSMTYGTNVIPIK